MKTCTSCYTAKDISEFYKHKGYAGGYQTWCKHCHQLDRKTRRHTYADQENAYKKQYRIINAKKINAYNAARGKMHRPEWLTALNCAHIKLFYETASKLTSETGTKFHVDHIIPLQGKNVSGLHVPWNLQVISAIENLKKHNKVATNG